MTREELPDLPRIRIEWRWAMALAAVTGIITWWAYTSIYPTLPDPMPVHWNAAGEADGFEPKSLRNFLFITLLGPVIVLVSLVGSQTLISMLSGTITERGSNISDANQAHRVWHSHKHMMRALGWFSFCLSTFISLEIVLTYHPAFPSNFVILMLGIVGLTALLMWSVVRNQRELERRYPLPEGERGKRWGIFVNDPSDSRILVPSPDSMGSNFTTNVGHTKGKIATLLIFGLPLALLGLAFI